MNIIHFCSPNVSKYLTCRYNPYLKVLTEEKYDQKLMKKIRGQTIEKASKASEWGIILGTLGRQGSTKVLDNILVCIHIIFYLL